jgi:DNA-binding LytR/AlgR family response regulator
MREQAGKSREPHGFADRASRIAAAYVADHGRNYVIALVAGAFMALVGAFGSQSAPLTVRLVYWIGLILAGTVIGDLVGRALSRRPKLGENRVLTWATTAALVSMPTTLIVWAVTGFTFEHGCKLADLPYYFGAVLTVSAAMTAIVMVVNTPGAATHAPAADAAPARIRFLDRLPPRLMGAAIYAVQSEDHYLRLHTSKGQELILLRLADAIAELDGVEGAQVHRSWWVARDAVADVRREGARIILVLRNAAEAPVSRPNVKPLRDAGWF